MAQLEQFDARCDTEGCVGRATWSVTSGGVVKSRHCSRHAPNALKEANKVEQESKQKPQAVRS